MAILIDKDEKMSNTPGNYKYMTLVSQWVYQTICLKWQCTLICPTLFSNAR